MWAASALSTLGDGVTLVAGPLLVASRTSDPALVAGAAFVQQLPWLLVSLVSGAYADRVDRRALVVAVGLVRAAALGVLVWSVATGTGTVPVLYAVLFVLGVGETLAESATAAILPAVVPPDRLATANARLTGAFTVAHQFVAKPLGAWLFGVAAAVPFGVDAVTFVGAAALFATVRPVPGAPRTGRSGLRGDIAAGVRWLAGHRLLRTLAVAMGLGNVAFCAAFATFVLYARQRLGLPPVGYGVLLTALAAGGLLGSLVAARLRARLGPAVLLRAGLLVEAGTHLTLALTTVPWLAGGVLVVFGVQTTSWGITTATLRQQAVPDPLRARVASVYALLETGGAALGSLAGAVLSRYLGLVAPFWIAALTMALIAAATWRTLRAAG